MKTVKTALGEKQIEDWDYNLIPLQLREVLQELRGYLIDKLIAGGLEPYITSKFNRPVDTNTLKEIKSKLKILRNSGVDINNYRTILEMVLQRENSFIDTAFFYPEIDNTIKWHLQPKLNMQTTPVFGPLDFIQAIRKGLVTKILTEEGLKDYVYLTYGAKLNDRAKVHYLLNELSDYFYKAQIDHKAILKEFEKNKGSDLQELMEAHFDNEVEPILDKHFEQDSRSYETIKISSTGK
jgi:hypothetical protein